MQSKNRFFIKRKIDDTIGKIISINNKKQKKFPQNFKKVIIFKLSALGDSILTLPAIKKLKEETHAEIIVIHSSDNKYVFQGQNFIDKTILIDVAKNNPLQLMQGLLKAKKEKADIAIDLSHTGNLSSVWANMVGKYSIGFFNPEYPKRKNLYDFEFNLNLSKHMILNYFGIFEKLCASPNKKLELIKLIFDKKDESFVNSLIKNKKNLVGIHPCHEISKKSWSKKNFAKIIDYLIDKGKFPVILGSPKESNEVDKLLNLIKSKNEILNLSGKLTIPQVFALMKYLDFFIANDGGIMHISAAMGLPTLGIFSIETPLRYAPFNKKSLSLYLSKGPSEKLSDEELKKILDYFL